MYYSTKEVADLFMVTSQTIYIWVTKGLLQPDFTTPTNRRYFLKSKIDKMLREGGQCGSSEN